MKEHPVLFTMSMGEIMEERRRRYLYAQSGINMGIVDGARFKELQAYVNEPLPSPEYFKNIQEKKP